MSTNSNRTCAITNCDSLLGYALAYRLLSDMKHRKDTGSEIQRVRVLYRKDIDHLGLDKLKELGAELVEADYSSVDSLKTALKGIHTVVLIPENSKNRLKEAKRLIKAAQNCNVEHLSMMSITGVDQVRRSLTEETAKTGIFHNFFEYDKIERKVRKKFGGSKHCIVRHAMFNQLFYFLAPEIEGQNVLPLPVDRNQKWSTVDLNDVTECVWKLLQRSKEERLAATKLTWDLAGERPKRSEEMSEDIAKGLGREELRYAQVKDEEVRDMLVRMRNDKRFKGRMPGKKEDRRLNDDSDDDESDVEKDGESPIEAVERRDGRDGFSTFPLGKFLNDQNIETMIEYWRMVTLGREDIGLSDLKDVIGRRPYGVRDYFKANRDNFQRLK
ncbi:NAD(P)-binding protein [Backusella circina FSU 941]|nr:NAD(P)-binding protein [Backusella circina FSU 941]